ncbi:hypothetical protein ONS95_007146 [Cadophora gregata]|uniref:uncharacterized protein n=1 Tax=Cadophora gregata TaxID=51156 RepID=UPI0026DCC109|nr:uncharacterized protein ONS95_007146 [Cadophora gregata]KAK0100694.1 hypothetical protein ONS95_007146 [Cadophora gregata]KAK0117309.1 hypothetical protein ONS96_013141 [Cadophora gregata f. sp. sojae]
MVLKVLIVGGGIAGPSLAYWLSRLNTEVTLIERFPRIRAYGQQVDLRGQGVPMMKKMGIEAAVRAAAVHEPGMQLVDQDGKQTAYFPTMATDTTQQSFSSEFEIMRGDLIKILYDLTQSKRNVQHIFNISVKNLKEDDTKGPEGNVHVEFSDGRKDNFDLVVGADGSGSQIRKIMLGPDGPDPRYSLNAHMGFFTIPSLPGDSDKWTFCNLPGRRVIGTRRDRPDLLRIYMIIYGKQLALEAAQRSDNLENLKEEWDALFRGKGWKTDRFMHDLMHSPLADDLYSTRLEEVRLPKGHWSRGRIVLIGDAAHSQAVNGQGVTLGIVGSYVLAGEIAALARKEGTTLSAAVSQGARNYEETFRPMVSQTHGSSFALGTFLPDSQFGIKILHAIAGWAAKLGYGQSGGTGSDRMATWSTPQYPDLEVERID